MLQAAIGINAEIHIQSIDCVLKLADVYEKVELEAESEGLPRDVPEE